MMRGSLWCMPLGSKPTMSQLSPATDFSRKPVSLGSLDSKRLGRINLHGASRVKDARVMLNSPQMSAIGETLRQGLLLVSHLERKSNVNSLINTRASGTTGVDENHALIRSGCRVRSGRIFDQRNRSSAKLGILIVEGHLVHSVSLAVRARVKWNQHPAGSRNKPRPIARKDTK